LRITIKDIFGPAAPRQRGHAAGQVLRRGRIRLANPSGLVPVP